MCQRDSDIFSNRMRTALVRWSGDMCVSSSFMVSITLFGFLIYAIHPSVGPPVGCPKVCTRETNNLGEVNLTCSEPGTVATVTEISAECSRSVVKMIIQNQPRLISIEQHSFQNFSKLRHLQIELTGLTYLSEEAFEGSPDLEILFLRHNCIENFPQMLVQRLGLRELWLQGNPLRCNCTNAWLQNAPYLMDTADVICDSTTSTTDSVCHLKNPTLYNDTAFSMINYNDSSQGQSLVTTKKLVQCELPCVRADSNIIEVTEGSDVNITCETCNKAIPVEITWLITDFQSDWNISTDSDLHIHVLQLHNFQAEDNYRTVTCMGNNSNGLNSSMIRIVIPSPPKITHLDFFIESARLVIMYDVNCWPHPKMKWLKNGKLSPSNPFIIDTEVGMNSFGLFTGDRILDPMGPTTNGLYTLVATNREGSANRTINVTAPAQFVFIPPIFPDYPNFITSVANTTASSTLWRAASVFELQIFLAVTAGICVTVLVVVILACIRHRLKLPSHVGGKMQRYTLTSNRKQENFNEILPLAGIRLIENPYYNGRGQKNHKTNKLHIKTVKLETIILIRVIGEGAFGHVFLGSCAHLLKKDEFSPVAVKMLKGECSEALKKDLEREAEILESFDHENIITFYGICTEGEHCMMILEFMEHGDLKKYIRNHGPDEALIRRGDLPPANEKALTLVQLLQVAVQIASGMEYLASQHFVHRDLATRNCLVGSGLVVKIGDFGMSRDVYSTDYYKVGGEAAMLPVRWMPPESILYRTFTVESDVWSFGVTLWEVFTYGKQPWFEYSNLEVIEHIKNRHLLKHPPMCPEPVYKVMLGCWRLHPQDRLSMKEICRVINEDLLSNQHEYLEMIP